MGRWTALAKWSAENREAVALEKIRRDVEALPTVETREPRPEVCTEDACGCALEYVPAWEFQNSRGEWIGVEARYECPSCGKVVPL